MLQKLATLYTCSRQTPQQRCMSLVSSCSDCNTPSAEAWCQPWLMWQLTWSMTCICRAVFRCVSSGRPKGYCADNITYSMTPHDHTSAACTARPLGSVPTIGPKLGCMRTKIFHVPPATVCHVLLQHSAIMCAVQTSSRPGEILGFGFHGPCAAVRQTLPWACRPSCRAGGC